jgi:hypothetical protein
MSCIGQSTVIQKPQNGIVFSETAPSTPPFELKGQPLSNPPEAVRNAMQPVRKSDAVIDRSRDDYTADKNYYTVNVKTPNIIGRNVNTTLRYQNETYVQEFIAVHKNIWYDPSNTVPQVSMVFTAPNGSIIHICIPIEHQNTSERENLFLKYWLYRKPPSGQMPAGMTLNELLNFREASGQKVTFATLQYCLNVNPTNTQTKYILCLFGTPLRINTTQLENWFRDDIQLTDVRLQNTIPTETESTNKYIVKKEFDSILNFMLRGNYYKYAYDPRIVNDVKYFDIRSTQNVITPSYFAVTSKQIAGTMVKTPIQTEPGKRALQNIKCYPIDLVNQVDDNGNIVIDEDTNKPVDVKKVVSTNSTNQVPTPIEAADKIQLQKENEQKVMFWIIFGIVILIVVAILIATVVYMLKGTSYSPAMSGGVGVGGVGGV